MALKPFPPTVPPEELERVAYYLVARRIRDLEFLIEQSYDIQGTSYLVFYVRAQDASVGEYVDKYACAYKDVEDWIKQYPEYSRVMLDWFYLRDVDGSMQDARPPVENLGRFLMSHVKAAITKKSKLIRKLIRNDENAS
jgi:hypothetical protein